MLTRAAAAEFVTPAHDADSASALSDAHSFLRGALDDVDSAIDALDRCRQFQVNATVRAKVSELMLALDAVRSESPLWDVVDEQSREVKAAESRFDDGDDGRPGTARLSYSSNL
jgi:hypothetical protein